MLTIDGSQGEGGGQILRSTLALACLTHTPVKITRIRAGRDKPGLQRQHLAAVRAAQSICDGDLRGAELGSSQLQFHPGEIHPGTYTFPIATAGSATLVLQTVLPVLLTASAPSTLTFTGGTHNPFAPPVDFLDRCFLPILRRMGADVTLRLERHGFYPHGGGRFVVQIAPVARLQPLQLIDTSPITQRRAIAIVAGLSRDIAQRELDTACLALDWPDEVCEIRELPRDQGPGNAILLEVRRAETNEIVTAFGRRGVPAEAVAAEAVREMQRYLQADVPVGEHLADQLLLPFALAGSGEFITLPATSHSTTNARVIEQFLPVQFVMHEETKTPETTTPWRIRVTPR